MMKKAMQRAIRTWKDCRDYHKVDAVCQEGGADVRWGKGDHKVVSFHGQHMTYYTSHEMSTGVAREVFKFLVDTGLVHVILIAGLILGAWYVL